GSRCGPPPSVTSSTVRRRSPRSRESCRPEPAPDRRGPSRTTVPATPPGPRRLARRPRRPPPGPRGGPGAPNRAAPLGAISENIPLLLRGLGTTLALTALGSVFDL